MSNESKLTLIIILIIVGFWLVWQKTTSQQLEIEALKKEKSENEQQVIIEPEKTDDANVARDQQEEIKEQEKDVAKKEALEKETAEKEAQRLKNDEKIGHYTQLIELIKTYSTTNVDASKKLLLQKILKSIPEGDAEMSGLLLPYIYLCAAAIKDDELKNDCEKRIGNVDYLLKKKKIKCKECKPCSSCKGTGACSLCKGTGLKETNVNDTRKVLDYRDFQGRAHYKNVIVGKKKITCLKQCGKCRGTGKNPTCSKCRGQGEYWDTMNDRINEMEKNIVQNLSQRINVLRPHATPEQRRSSPEPVLSW